MQQPDQRQRKTAPLLLALIAGTALVAGCNRPADTTAATQPNGDVVARADRDTDASAAAAAANAREAGREAGKAVENAGEAIGNKARDVAITTEVNMRLARDPQLSALGINVDTSDGRVVLRGSAPDTASRTRATELAKGVDGVRDVNNELMVQPKS
jgi:hyperosmotically inducible periplasmic protein